MKRITISLMLLIGLFFVLPIVASETTTDDIFGNTNNSNLFENASRKEGFSEFDGSSLGREYILLKESEKFSFNIAADDETPTYTFCEYCRGTKVNGICSTADCPNSKGLNALKEEGQINDGIYPLLLSVILYFGIVAYRRFRPDKRNTASL